MGLENQKKIRSFKLSINLGISRLDHSVCPFPPALLMSKFAGLSALLERDRSEFFFTPQISLHL